MKKNTNATFLEVQVNLEKENLDLRAMSSANFETCF